MTREMPRGPMRDLIERRLRSEADVEEARYVARPLPATVAEARAVVRGRPGGLLRSTWLLAPVSAAVLVIVMVVVATWLGDRGAPVVGVDPSASAALGPSETATPAPSGAVSPSVAVSPSPADGPASCTAADVAVTSDRWGAAAGSRGTMVIFGIVDSVADCRLGGQLAARITDATGAVLVESLSAPTTPVMVHGGDRLEIGVTWSNWCGSEPVSPLALTVVLPGDTTAIPIVPPAGSQILVPPCMGAGQATNLSVTAFQPSYRPPPEG